MTDLHCECASRGMTGGKAHPLCPVHGHLHDAPQTCFELDGAKVRGNPDMSDESRDALRDALAAAQRLIGCGHACCDERTDPHHDHFLSADACCERRQP